LVYFVQFLNLGVYMGSLHYTVGCDSFVVVMSISRHSSGYDHGQRSHEQLNRSNDIRPWSETMTAVMWILACIGPETNFFELSYGPIFLLTCLKSSSSSSFRRWLRPSHLLRAYSSAFEEIGLVRKEIHSHGVRLVAQQNISVSTFNQRSRYTNWIYLVICFWRSFPNIAHGEPPWWGSSFRSPAASIISDALAPQISGFRVVGDGE
jgi:hypothetical protein